jgi:hypothetical protein
VAPVVEVVAGTAEEEEVVGFTDEVVTGLAVDDVIGLTDELEDTLMMVLTVVGFAEVVIAGLAVEVTGAAVEVTGFTVEDAILDIDAGAEAVMGPGTGMPKKVEPMSPKRMFEYVTVDAPCFDSTSVGLPEVVAHVPRATPGVEASLSSGKELR